MVSPNSANYIFSDSPIAAEALYLLDTHFKNVSSLREIIINFKVYPKQDPGDNLTKKIYNYGQTIKVIELPKRIQISLDNQVKFNNKEDCQVYNNKQFLINKRKRQQKEKEQQLEEYYR